MNKLTALIFVLLLPGLAAADTPPEPTGLPTGYEKLDRIRAIVDDEVITHFELERQFAPLAGAGWGILDEAARTKWFVDKRDEVLTEQINTLLIIKEARKLNLEIRPQEVAEHVRGLKAQNQWSDEDLAKFVVRIGFRDVDAYREHVEKEMLKAQAVSVRVGSRVRASKDEVERVFKRDFYGGKFADEIHAQHILFRLPNIATGQKIQELAERAAKVRAELLAETITFKDAAGEHSGDGNAQNAGDLGWFSRCTLDPDFERSAFAIAPGTIGEVVRTNFGFHIIRVLEKRKVPIGDDAPLKRCVRMDLEINNRVTAYEAYTKELRVYHHVVKMP